jgi:transmembrane sensor
LQKSGRYYLFSFGFIFIRSIRVLCPLSVIDLINNILKAKKVDISNLISKFFAGEISDNEIDALKSWLEEDPEHRRIFDQENELWQEASLSGNINKFKADTAWMNISSRLELNKWKNPVVIISKRRYLLLSLVASVALFVALGGISLWVSTRQAINNVSLASTLITTNEGERSHVTLPDSTEIFLNSGSRLEYNTQFNVKDRVVNLSGEAFFSIHKNPAKPFVVETGVMKIVATGTRFNVLSYNGEDRIETTLEEGKISALMSGGRSLNLTPGQQIVYFRKSGKIEVRDVPVDTYTSWKENKLRLKDTPFEEALRKIARKYNVTFEITSNDLLNLRYTATFIDESIEEVMSMLKTVSPITYKIHNRTSVDDKQYTKPRIVVGKRRN